MHTQFCLTLLWPRGLWPAKLLCPWDFPGKNTKRVTISFSRGSSQPKDQTHLSSVSCIGRQILFHYAIWEASRQGIPSVNLPVVTILSTQCRVLSNFTWLCNNHHYPFLELFLASCPVPSQLYFCLLPSWFQLWQTTLLLAVCINWRTLGTSYIDFLFFTFHS